MLLEEMSDNKKKSRKTECEETGLVLLTALCSSQQQYLPLPLRRMRSCEGDTRGPRSVRLQQEGWE